MKRGLGLDIGRSNVGLAHGTLNASELTTLKIEPFADFAKKLTEIIKDEEIEYLVIGVPISRKKSDSRDFIEKNIAKIKQIVNIPIFEVDETLSTKRAEELLKEEKLSISQIKLRSDQASAKIILQQYLDENI